ncbi:MAG: hypothetical protein HY064_02735 [Bacteroidetes bacterium]|nr:hypothetical protein [Bacteroidota bacterium]
MKTFLLFLFCFVTGIIHSQPPTNSAEFTYLGKKYSANYDAGKHLLTFSEEVSFEIYDSTGAVVKRGDGLKVDFRSLLKGGGEKTFTVKIYKQAKKSKKKKSTSIKEKGEIGTMLVTDELD